MARENTLSKETQVDAATESPVLRVVRGLTSKSGFPRLDCLIHERMRLTIVSTLSVNESLSFNDLKKLLDTTGNNLSVHARKPEEAVCIICVKYFDGWIPKTK